MKKQLVLIKLGGSLITDKKKEDTIRPDVIEQCVEEIESVRRALPDTDIIIGTGAGSFGHIQAHKYQLKAGARLAEQFYGMCMVHNNVRKLNEFVTGQLIAKELPAFSISPSAILMANDGTIASSFFQPVRQLLASGCIPMMHGDAVLDPIRGLTIMSTEKVLQACLENLRELYEEIVVIYCMDVSGIWDENRRTISVLERNQTPFSHKSSVRDVTGGIEGKVKSARYAAELAERVYLISGKEKGDLKKAIAGERVGTRVS